MAGVTIASTLLAMAGAGLAAPQPASAAPAPAPAETAAPASPPAPGDAVDQMLDLPLEDLLTMETTSVARKRQSVRDSAAAVFVITQEDIAHSAASTIPELLRLAPGIEVAQIQNGEIGVAARGFNSPLSNSLLVLVDGRAIYFSSLSGVLWSQQLLPLSEIERIEIVRGPGATLWGSNAVNGVVNIISKHASAARGVRIDTRIDTREQQVALSGNGVVGEDLSYRVYARMRRNRGLNDAAGSPLTHVGSDFGMGLRIDYEPDLDSAYTLQADLAAGHHGEKVHLVNADLAQPGYRVAHFDNRFVNASLLGRMSRRLSDGLDFSFQAYVNRTTVKLKGLDGAQTMVDGDMGLRFSPSPRHEINIGLAARLNITDVLKNGTTFRLQADHFHDSWISGYIQDDIWIVPDKVRLTVGSKLEYNSITGFEFQPGAKLWAQLGADHAIWGGVSRTARTPSIYERTANFYGLYEPPGSSANPSPFDVYINARGNPDLSAERMTAFEIGLRGKLGRGWTYDIAGYYNRYSKLIGPVMAGFAPIPAPSDVFTCSNPMTPPVFETAMRFENSETAASWGVEALVSGAITPWWRADFTYSRLGVVDPGASGYLRTSPQDQFGLRTAIDITDRLIVSAHLRHVGRLETGPVPAYQSLDLRIRKVLKPNVELSLIGRNLLSPQHLEFYDPRFPALPGYVPRSVSVQLVGAF